MSVGKNHPLSRIPLRSGEYVIRPYIDVKYINPHTGKHISVVALVDTGSDICLFPAEHAETLGHNVTEGIKDSIFGAGEEQIDTYMHTMIISIPGFTTNEVQIMVGENIKEPILGVCTFLHNFILTIDYPQEVFSLRTPETPEGLFDYGMP